MKRISSFLIALVFLVMATSAYGATTIYMPYTYDDDNPRTAVITEKATLTYQGYWAEEDMSDPAFIYLKPSSGGKLRLTINSTTTDDRQLCVYDGQKDVAAGFNWTDLLPKDDKGQVENGKVYDSEAADGSLTVAWFEGNGDYYKWTATVEELSSADMSVVSTTTVDLSSVSALVGAQAQPFAAINVKTEGGNNPLSVTNIGYELASNQDMFSNLKLVYMGGSSVYDASKATDFSGNQKLSGGNNYFFLLGDVAASAKVGDAVGVNFTSVKVGEEEKLASPIASSSVKLSNELLMPKSGTFTVGDAGYSFYDDGGKNGKISSKFDGTITFVPSDPSKKVMIDFSKVALYESAYGSDSYNDKMYVYNGRDKSNLNQQIRNGKPVIVRSAADDGSLTVTLKSVTGDYYIGQGFEAAVSQFTASPMTLKSISAAAASSETVSGGNKNQPMMSVVVETENTDPALTASKFSFTTAGTFANVAKATVYYTGINDAFATTTKVGEAEVTADNFTVTATEPVKLVEGKNYFWLAYDIAESAVDGVKVDAGVSSVTLSDAEHAVASGNPEGDRTVLNVVYATLGSQTKVVYGSTLFKDEHNDLYGKYDPVPGERIVTFVPATKGKIIELDFSEFAVTYSSSSYGVKAKFEVYSGSKATGTPLWKLSSVDEASKGPGKPLRSAAADGSMTVVFDCIDSQSYYASKGWTATAREYESKAMEVKNIEVAQATTDFAASGIADQEILKVKVTTEGDRNHLKVDKLSLDLKGGQTNVDKVKVYSTGTSEVFSIETLLGSAVVDASASAVDVDFTNVILPEGNSYYWVAFDVKKDAVPGSLLDAKLVSATIEGNAVAVPNGDPEGGREIKNVYLMPVSETETVEVGKYAYMFYDDGGAYGDYSKNKGGAVTFVPQNENSAIQFTFSKFKVSSGDELCLYNGKEATEENLIGKYGMYDAPEAGTVILSKSDDGAITVKFNTEGYSLNEGWEIEVSAKELKPLAVGSVAATVATEKAELLGGVVNEPMLRVAVETTGDRGAFNVDELSFAVTNSSDLSGMDVFYTGTSDIFSTDVKFGDTQSGESPVFVGSKEIKGPGIHYFWLAASIKSDAKIGDVVTFKQTGAKVGGSTVEIGESATASISVKDGLKGTYTIGKDGDYATVTAAIAAMKDGINGAVVFEILNGTYDEELLMPEIPGASEYNTITIKSQSGNYSDVVIKSDNFKSGYEDENSAVMTVYGADYLTLEGITFSNPDQTYNYLVDVKNSSNYVTVKNCYFKGVEYTSDPYYTDKHSLLHTNFVNKPVANTPDTYMSITGNIFEGGYIGASVGGYSAADMNRGTRVVGNTFKGQWSKAIYASYDESAEISGNTVTSSAATSKEFVAIDLNNVVSSTISGNSITTSMAYVSGIKMRPVTGTADKPFRVYNNVLNIKNTDTSNPAYAISLTGGSNNNKPGSIEVAHNTIVITGSSAKKSAGVYNTSNFTESMVIENNIIQNEAGGYVYRVNSKPMKATTFNNNSLYTSGSDFAFNYTTFENWQKGSKESDSRNQKVEFLSADVLSPKTLESVSFAKPLDYVSMDIAGNERDKVAPSVGAYEFVVEKAPAMVEGYPKLSGEAGLDKADIAVKVTANANVYYLVKTVAEVPSVDDVVAAGNKVEASKNQEVIVKLTGLNPSTEYHVFFLLENLVNPELRSEVIAMQPFTTQEPKPEPLVLTLDKESITVDAGEKVVVVATVTGGVEPYSYSWTNAMNEEVSKSATIEFAAVTSGDYKLTVTDARNSEVRAKVRVIVHGEAKVATFDDLYLAPESYWMGDADADPEEMYGSFISGSYEFSNLYMPDYDTWGLFGYSNLTKTTFSELFPDQFASVVGHGVDGSSNYSIVYASDMMGQTTVNVLNNPEGEELRGCYVTNSAWVGHVKDNGTGMDTSDGGATEPFKTGDYLKLTATGDNGKTAEFYLVDYRNDVDHVFVDTWKWFDLSGLGKVKSVTFSLDGTRKNTYGTTIPTYFCMDDFNGVNKDGGVTSVAAGGRIYVLGDIIKFEQYAGFSFKVYTIGGQMVDSFNVASTAESISANYVKGVYLLVGTDGVRSVTQKIMIK